MFVDIGIGVILLIGFIVGIVRGAGKSFIKLLSIAGAAVLTWRLTPYVMRFMLETDLFKQLIFGQGVSLLTLFKETELASISTSSPIFTAICEPLRAYISSAPLSFEQYLPYLLAAFSATIIVSLIVYLVVRLLVMIIASILKGIFIKNEPSKFSRFIGSLLGIVNGALVVCIIYILSASIVGLPVLTQPIVEQTQTSYAVNYTYSIVVDNYSKVMIEDDHLGVCSLTEAIIQAEKDAGIRA